MNSSPARGYGPGLDYLSTIGVSGARKQYGMAITVRYRPTVGERKERTFRSIGAARRWCMTVLTPPVEIHAAFGFATDRDGNALIAVSCNLDELLPTSKPRRRS